MSADLVERSRGGDHQAFEALMGQYWRQAEAVAAAVVNHDHNAVADILQESFLLAYRKLGSLADNNRFAPWLLRIVRNQAVSWLRRHSRHRLRAQPIDENELITAPTTDQPEDPWTALLPQALAGLRPADREMLHLKYQAGLDYQQLSDSLGISLAAVEKRLYRARRRLEQTLSELTPDDA